MVYVAVGLGLDAQNLAAQVVGVSGASLRVKNRAARPLVDRCKTARFEGVGVVARGDVELAAGAKRQRPSLVVRVRTVGVKRKQDFFGSRVELIPHKREPRQALIGHGARRGPEEIDPMVGLKVRDRAQCRASRVRRRNRCLTGPQRRWSPSPGCKSSLRRRVRRKTRGHRARPPGSLGC